MKYVEKKFRLDTFDSLRAKLVELNAIKLKDGSSRHYYAELDNDDVIKIVSSQSGEAAVIALRKSSGNTFEQVDKLSLSNVKAGFEWLKNRGYSRVGVLDIEYSKYEYQGGEVGLYIISGFLKSVILDFPANKHEEIEGLLGLSNEESIGVPYNKYLKTLGKLEMIEL
jgi:hypothetical protein